MKLRLAAIALIFQSLATFAAQLDLALVEFPETKTSELLQTALANVNLAEITSADRTVTKVSYLQNGEVLFAQSLNINGEFRTSTRLKNSKADVEGRLQNGQLQVQITLTEGVDVGLRRFSKRIFEGTARLTPGQPCVISIRSLSGKTRTIVKNLSEVKEFNTSNFIIAQLK